MPKDSQPDNKVARMEKCNFQTPITSEEGKKCIIEQQKNIL